MRFVWITMLLWGAAIAYEVPKNGQSVLPFTLEDQHGKRVTVKEARVVIYLPDEPAGDLWHAYAGTKPAGFFTKTGVRIVADISNAPRFVRSLFILPGLRKYGYEVLVVTDEFSPVIFESELEKVSVVAIENGIQTEVKKAATKEELEVMMEGVGDGKNR